MLTKRLFRSVLITSVLAASAFVCGSASASVAYIDGGEIWVSSDDGSRKIQLSAGAAGTGVWREVAQSDQGYIVGTRKVPNLISQTAAFTVWDPNGQVVHFGSL